MTNGAAGILEQNATVDEAALERLRQHLETSRGRVGKDELVSHEIIARDFRSAAEGKLEPRIIDDAVASLLKLTLDDAAQAEASFSGAVFYMHVDLTCGSIFKGDAGGLFSIGSTAANGVLSAHSFPDLIHRTRHFYAHTMGAYSAILFFDGGNNLLGEFQSTAAWGTFVGAGAGTGRWS